MAFNDFVHAAEILLRVTNSSVNCYKTAENCIFYNELEESNFCENIHITVKITLI